MSSETYILAEDGKTPIPEPDLEKWSMWYGADFEKSHRVALDQIGPFKVSTIFLGLDHGFNFSETPGVPVLWETMIFGPYGHELDQSQWRYTSYKSAVEGHKAACQLTKLALEGEMSVDPVMFPALETIDAATSPLKARIRELEERIEKTREVLSIAIKKYPYPSKYSYFFRRVQHAFEVLTQEGK